MVTGKVYYGAVLVVLVCLSASSCKGAERNSTDGKDTIILARSDQSFTIDSGRPFYQVKLTSTGQKLSEGKKVFLLLDTPRIMQNPEGVYEVYVTRESSDVKMLLSSDPGFVNVLDIYGLTVNEAPKLLSIDIDLTKKLVGLAAKAGQPIPPIIVIILFRGNVSPGNIESKQAVQMTVKGMRLVQEQ